MSSSGSCFCSQVKYTFSGPPALQAICHCLECRKISGSAFTTNLLVPATAFQLVQGSQHVKSFSQKHESGMALTVHFCERCGSTLYKEGDSEAFKGLLIVQAGSLDSGDVALEHVDLGVELYVKYRVAWLKEMQGVTQCEQFP